MSRPTNSGPPPADYEIVLRDPQPILRKKLGDYLVVLDFESDSLVKAGDNYGSTILKVRVIVKRGKNAEKEELHLVAKMLPPTDFQRSIFDSAFTFKKEIFLYEELIPMYRSLYKGAFDVVPECYGCALSSKNGADEVDEDAVILLENLKVKGYYMADRHEGLNYDHLKIAVTTLAKFHAIGLSIKHKKPAYLATVQTYAKPLAVGSQNMFPFLDGMLEALSNDPSTSKYVDCIKMTRDPEDIAKSYFQSLEPTDPWACVVHTDFWVNNALFHKDELTGKVNDCKLVDFQTYCLSSPLIDLLFLLCTSMESDLKWFDEMLEFYRKVALEVLEELGCAVELFEKKSFEKRLKIDAAKEMIHIILMSKVVELRQGENLLTSPVNEFCMKRLRRIVDIYVQKNWI
ncbi:uncharacterized protein LOC103316329 isoform X1 [Nasonia vitripennis]|uniref:CHK kinase-like domain-containing protein n=1 Tax=Nasonia vitripennis TaxID=7425 RepID=A0A7M7R177_NASVI|nr:uncharacterized protein LOC103316329 isoform X1 [Nasonia vitripennis]XP_032457602.1 uncharacterized protein LOC103316329 isoform X1 [Nasonia vitripennis]